jgi:starch synthase
MRRVTVLAVASEIFPLVKTGGLADVVGALPPALAREGIATRTLVPGYPGVLDALRAAETIHTFARLHGGPARLLGAHVAGLDLLVLDAPHLYARPGNPYLRPDGSEWLDNALRFAALAECAVAIARGAGAVAGLAPDVVHAHDWQAGLVPALLHYGDGPRPGTVMTVHNLSFQGLFPRELLATIGLPPHAYAIDGVEYHGTIGYLKAGLALADRLTTVSPTYAAEIRTQEGGMGLDGLLRARADVLTGILNGIDETVWNPATDTHLAARFDARSLARRAANKTVLQARFGLDPEPATFVLGVVSRLTLQKGMDLLLGALPALTAGGAQLALLGTGERPLEDGFAAAVSRHAGRVGAVIGYDESLAHLMQAGADALLVPSRFEPCGLTQLCALRYGAIPIVARVGGLADTVVDANEMALAAGSGTGIQFAPVTRESLELAIGRAIALSRDRASWRRMQLRGMATDVGWTRPAERYAALFRDLAAHREA